MEQTDIEVVHVIYSGVGGSSQIALSLVNRFTNKNQSVLFIGIENVLAEYISLCRQNQVKYLFYKKRKGIDLGLFFLLIKNFAQNPKARYLIHVNAVLPFISVLKLFYHRSIFLVEHQSVRSKKKRENLYSLLASISNIKRVFITPYSADKARNWLGRKLKNPVIIPNGVDTNYFSSSPVPALQTGSRRIIIGMASRIDEQREHLILIEALAKLKTEGLSVELWVAGNDLGMLNDILGQVRRLNLEDSFQYKGVLDKNEMLSFYKSLDIYVHATKYETLSTSILQAMSCQLPVFMSNIPENVLNFRSPIPYQQGDSNDLFKKLLDAINSNNYIGIGINCRREVESKYSLQSMVDSYFNMLWP